MQKITLSCQFCEQFRSAADDRLKGDVWEAKCAKRDIWVRERYPVCSDFRAYMRFFCKSRHDWISLKSCINGIRSGQFDCLNCQLKDYHLEAKRMTFANMASDTQDCVVTRVRRETPPVVRIKRG